MARLIDYARMLLGIGPTEVATKWDGKDLLVQEKCLLTGMVLRTYRVEFDWPKDPGELVEWKGKKG
jgi:hypothetical protein